MKRLLRIAGGSAALVGLAMLALSCRNPMATVDVLAQARRSAAPPAIAAEPGELVAGRTIPVGRVIVTLDTGHLSVTYLLSAGWQMTESHVAVAQNAAGIPQTKTHNPIPGKFPFSMRHAPPATGYTYVVDLGALGLAEAAAVCIAAHAEVQQVDGEGNVVQQESAWAAGVQFAGPNWATYFVYEAPVSHSVVYDGNGATEGEVPTDAALYLPGQPVTVLGNTGNLTMSGFAFSGWNSSADGTGETLTGGQSFSMGNTDVTLFALWVPVPVSLAGYWDATMTLGDDVIGPMAFVISQTGASLEGAFYGTGTLLGTLEGSAFNLAGDIFGNSASFVGTVSGSELVGTVTAGTMGAGTFVMVRSTKSFGHLDLHGSFQGSPISLDTEYALATTPQTMTYERFRFSLDLGGVPAELWCCTSEQVAGMYAVTEFDPENQPGLISITLWQAGEHRATGGYFDITTWDTVGMEGSFHLEFPDGIGTLEGNIDLHFGALGEASVNGAPPVPTWSELTESSFSFFMISFWDTRRAVTFFVNTNGRMDKPDYVIPEEAHVDFMWSIEGEPQPEAEANMPGILHFSEFGPTRAVGTFNSGFSEGGTIVGNFAVNY